MANELNPLQNMVFSIIPKESERKREEEDARQLLKESKVFCLFRNCL